MVSPQNEGIKLCSPLAKEKICTESPTPGALQQHLFYGEYDPFKYAPIFESDFVQVTKKGEVLNIHNQVTVVTVGVTSTSPNFALPNVMLLARPINALKEMMCNCSVSDDRCPMELTRLFPLSFVNISIHDVYNHRLRLKLANGRAFYLQLYVHPDCENEVFERWMKLVNLLHTTPEDVYGYEAVTPEIECILEQGSLETSVTELSEWQLEPSEMTPGMRDFYEASRASSKSKKSKKSDKSDKSDCSEKTQSKRSKKSGSSKTGGSDADSVPVFDQDQERWPPVEPPKKKKKRRGSIGFNFFNKGDKGSKERATGAKEKAVPPPVRPEGQAPKGRSAKEEKGGRKSKDEAKKKQEDKSKGKEDKGEKEKKRQREKEERQKGKAERQREKEERQRAKEAKQREKAEEKQREREGGKQKGARDDKRGSQKETRQREKEARQREKETRQRAKEARQREKAEKKQREREDRKQKRGKDDKRGKEPEKRQRGKEGKKQQDKKKPSKAPDSKPKGDKEKIDGRKMDEAVRELRPRVEKQLEDNQV